MPEHYLTRLFFIFSGILSFACSVNVILNVRNPRAALWWICVVWAFPLVGPLFYSMIGINRIKRRAPRFFRLLRKKNRYAVPFYRPDEALSVSAKIKSFESLTQIVDEITKKSLTSGNQIYSLINGENAYPRMLQAIEEAQHSITLMTYIFANDRVGRWFVDALARAHKRGVEVRVLIDDLTSVFSLGSAYQVLKSLKVPVAAFHPAFSFSHLPYFNLRNHRKILVVDGRLGFSGGMNIQEDHLVQLNPLYPTEDIHFQITGPVVAHLQETFAEDWFFSTNEILKGNMWFPPPVPKGPCLARGIPTGPDKNFEQGIWILLAAITQAKSSIRIMTPYFVPDLSLITALNLAAMRHVKIDIFIPETSDFPMTYWASFSFLDQLIEHGCRVWITPPPFNHGKIFVVDGTWVLFGSSNWDDRSLRINFEFNVECYDENLASHLNAMMEQKKADAREVKLKDLERRPFPLKLRDGLARLFSPSL